MRDRERWEHGNEKDNSPDKPKQDIKSGAGTMRPHRTKAEGFLGEIQAKIL